MARIKPEGIKTLETLKEADDVLFQIAQLRTKLKLIDADAEKEINKIREKAAAKAEGIKQMIEKLGASLQLFAETNRDELFAKKKSVELTFGFLGYRMSTRISVKKSTVAKLKELGMLDCIIVKETPNKEALEKQPDAILKQVDAKRIKDDKFWYEVKEEEITNTAAKQVS